MKEVRQLHAVEREIDELFHKFAPYATNGDSRPRVQGETTRSRLELLTEKDSDLNPRIEARNHLKWREAPAVPNYSSPSIVSSKPPLGKSNVIFAVGRIAIVITFIMSALFRLVDLDTSANSITSKLLPLPGSLVDATAWIEATLGVPLATILVMAGAVLECAAAVLIAMGMLIRPASVVLLIFTAIGIYGSQWDFHNGVRPDQIIRALNELSMMGALLVLSSRVRGAD